MHKLPQPVKLWYLSSFFRRERPQKGRFRQFWQVGAEAIGSDDPAVDAEAILLLSELLEALGCRGVRLRIGSLGTPETRRAYREELQSYLRAHEAELAEEVVARIELNPLRAFDSDHRGTQAVMAGAPRLLDRLTDADAEHFATVCALLDRGRPVLRGRRHARARARLLHAHGVRVHLGRARRAVRGRRRRPLRRPDRADRRPAHARDRLGERRRADAAHREHARGGARAARPLRRLRHRGAAHRGLPPGRRRAPGRLRGETRTRRPLAQGPAQAGRQRGRPLRCDPARGRDVPARHGDRRAAAGGDRHRDAPHRAQVRACAL